jgi:threonine/homoserine/homoserine lactone efflux protein
MTLETFLALSLYSFVASATPGPNNLMLLASGVNFGIRRTVPHMLGIAIGFTAMVAIIGFGLGALLDIVPGLMTGLRYVALAYTVWLAWKLGTSGSLGTSEAGAQPMSFISACLFQWVNPKAWVMALTATALYTTADHYVVSVLLVAAVFGIINLPCISVWAGFGVALRGFLSVPWRLRAFNVVMGVLLLASTVPFLFE